MPNFVQVLRITCNNISSGQ